MGQALKLVDKLVNYKGYTVQKLYPVNDHFGSINPNEYSTVFPSANYTPWLADTDFMETYELIKNNTLVDILRCYEIWSLVEQACRNNADSSVIEIGVWRGGTSTLMAKKLSLLQNHRPFYLCDTFTGVVNTGQNDNYYVGGEHSDTSVEIVENLIQKAHYPNYRLLHGIFPEETSHLIDSGETFAFCHIDVDVYDSCKNIIDWIWNKLTIGGIVLFDDYGFHTCAGVTKFVNEQKYLPDRLVIHNLNGHGIIIKTKV